MGLGQPAVLAIGGTTASGKSQLALAVAQRLEGEIVTADSAQVYRGMDIGTDKPDARTRSLVPHHLLDIRAPGEAFSVAEYQKLADAAIAAIAACGHLPLLVGGTGLYLRQVLRGADLPPAPPQPALRARLRRLAPEALYAELARADPEAARRIHPHNVRRVIRALEILAVTGQPPSRFGGAGTPRYPHRLVVLDRPSPVLRARIAARVERMLATGLVNEVRALLDQGVDPAAPGLAALGYRQTVAHLLTGGSVADLARAIEQATWQYARRQRTWFRREADAFWVDLGEGPAEAGLPRVLDVWSGTSRGDPAPDPA